MFEGITEVIGFDLGHGETALSRLNLRDPNNIGEPDLIEIVAGFKNIPTAIGYLSDGEVLIGEMAVTLKKSNVQESFIAFKRRPNGDFLYQKTMNDFINKIYQQKIEQGQINEDSTFFFVGCPSEWTQDISIVDAYQKIFSDAGIKNVKVVPESRAAYIQVAEKNLFLLKESTATVIVIDLGSSTTDITIIDQGKNSIPIDIGRDLGASLIDKMILKLFLDNSNQDVQLLFQSDAHFRNQCEFTCRKAKEALFANPEQYPNSDQPLTLIERKNNKFFLEFSVHSLMMKEILNTPCINIEGEMMSWIQAFRNELIRLNSELEYRQRLDQSKNLVPGAILLTGGASRMNFVRELCQEVFPDIPIKNDDAPEFCISRGLARWGRIEIKTSQFSKDIDEFCLNNITPRVSNNIDELYEGISKVLADQVIAIAKKNFLLWKKREIYTIKGMETNIDKEINKLLEEKNLSKIVIERIPPILKAISDDLQVDIRKIENRYNIATGTLGNSFYFEKMDMKNLMLNRRSSLSATDDILSDVSKVVGWVAGILVTVVAWGLRTTLLSITYPIVYTIISVIASILAFNPIGLSVVATFGIVIFVTGKSAGKIKQAAQEAIEENLPGWDLPIVARNLIGENSVFDKLNDQHKEIYNQLFSGLKNDNNIRQELTNIISKIFEKILKEKADEMRVLIS